MAHIIINPSLSAAIGYTFFFNPPKFAVVIAILESANSTRTDNSTYHSNILSKTSSIAHNLLLFVLAVVHSHGR